MLGHYSRTPVKNLTDPEEVMIGKCATCGTVLEVPRWKAVTNDPKNKQFGKDLGPWSDLIYAECQRCKETSLTKNGCRVYLSPKKRLTPEQLSLFTPHT